MNADPRTFPKACNEAGRKGLWNAAIAAVNPAPALPAKFGGVEKVTSHLNLLDPGGCNILKPVPTGIMIKKGAGFFEDAVCPAPGCHYNDAKKCEK